MNMSPKFVKVEETVENKLIKVRRKAKNKLNTLRGKQDRSDNASLRLIAGLSTKANRSGRGKHFASSGLP